jgi:hypothetical protein
MSQTQTPVTPKKEAKQNLKYKRDKHREMVRGVFKFFEVPGGEMGFTFREFKEDPIENYVMVDGEVYTVPLGVAKHLNTNCWYPQYEFLPGENVQAAGRAVRGFAGHVQKITKKVRRCAFNSLEFLDIDDLPQPQSAVVTVETVV